MTKVWITIEILFRSLGVPFEVKVLDSSGNQFLRFQSDSTGVLQVPYEVRNADRLQQDSSYWLVFPYGSLGGNRYFAGSLVLRMPPIPKDTLIKLELSSRKQYRCIHVSFKSSAEYKNKLSADYQDTYWYIEDLESPTTKAQLALREALKDSSLDRLDLQQLYQSRLWDNALDNFWHNVPHKKIRLYVPRAKTLRLFVYPDSGLWNAWHEKAYLEEFRHGIRAKFNCKPLKYGTSRFYIFPTRFQNRLKIEWLSRKEFYDLQRRKQKKWNKAQIRLEKRRNGE